MFRDVAKFRGGILGKIIHGYFNINFIIHPGAMFIIVERSIGIPDIGRIQKIII